MSRTVHKVLLAGRLTRDPDMRAMASGNHVRQFSVATTEYAGNGKEPKKIIDAADAAGVFREEPLDLRATATSRQSAYLPICRR